ncbi:MAG TPA: STAS domain-containing protein [Candidatus Binatia bacterium]|nr:STAS domain-containing protein [Candidatus Binatia bacterium]
MNIHEESTDGFLILCLEGRLDANSAKTFEKKILAVIDGGETRFVLDLSRLDYVSSAGLRVFFLASQRLAPSGNKLVLCSVQESVKQVFDILGFYSIFSISSSKD